MDPDASSEATLATVDAARAASVADLRRLADRLEALSLDDLRRQAAFALECAPR